jgi:hypothetical protein
MPARGGRALLSAATALKNAAIRIAGLNRKYAARKKGFYRDEGLDGFFALASQGKFKRIFQANSAANLGGRRPA